MANIIKKVKIGNTYYDIYDEYARARLDGQGALYAIDLNPFNTSSEEIPMGYYRDVLTGDLIDDGSPGPTYVNKRFNTTTEPLNINIWAITDPDYVSEVLILTSSVTTGGHTYKNYIRLSSLEVGDVILVTDNNVPDRWSDVDSTQIHFRALEAKAVDLSGYVQKDIYATGAPSNNNTGSTGGQTGWADIGTATGSGTVDGLAPNATGSTDLGTKNTSNNGAHTINGSNFTFTGTTATFTSNVSVSDHAAQTLTISGSQSVGNHSHSIGKSTVSLTYVSDVTITASVDNHTHSISGTRATQTVVTTVDAATGNAGGHSHTVDSHEHAADVTALTDGTTFNAGTTPSFGTIGTTVTKGAYGFSSSSAWAFPSSITVNSTTGKGVLSDPVVDANGILSFTYSGATTQASTEVATNVTAFRNGTWSAGTTPSLTKATATVAGKPSASTLNTSSAASHTHSIGKSTTSITYVSTVTVTGAAGSHAHTITPTKATQTVVTSVDANTGNAGAHTIQGSNFSAALPTLTHSVTNGNITYQPAGTIGGSQSVGSHTHSVTLGAHTHSITSVSGTISISVAVGSHSHTVNNHSHSLNNHTHSVDLR